MTPDVCFHKCCTTHVCDLVLLSVKCIVLLNFFSHSLQVVLISCVVPFVTKCFPAGIGDVKPNVVCTLVRKIRFLILLTAFAYRKSRVCRRQSYLSATQYSSCTITYELLTTYHKGWSQLVQEPVYKVEITKKFVFLITINLLRCSYSMY